MLAVEQTEGLGLLERYLANQLMAQSGKLRVRSLRIKSR